jgi:hypothetical protein
METPTRRKSSEIISKFSFPVSVKPWPLPNRHCSSIAAGCRNRGASDLRKPRNQQVNGVRKPGATCFDPLALPDAA